MMVAAGEASGSGDEDEDSFIHVTAEDFVEVQLDNDDDDACFVQEVFSASSDDDGGGADDDDDAEDELARLSGFLPVRKLSLIHI